MSRVALFACVNYEPEEVRRAVSEALAAIGGLASFVREGQTVLLKPNLLSSKAPELAVTTHPAIVEAVALEAVKLGAKVVIGDSPPYQGQNPRRYESLCQVTGMREVADRVGAEIVSLDHPQREVETGGKLFKKLPVSAAVLDADVVINLPKLKTHGLTGFTGAVKNMFGCVPGLKKSQLHLQAREGREVFSEMLVDVFAACKPTLNVMDAVVAMEGPGPSKGRPKQVGAILASADAVSLDSVARELIGFSLSSIAHIRLAAERGLGEAGLGHIEIVGSDLDTLRVHDFSPSPTIGSGFAGMPAPLYKIVKNQFVPMPRVIADKCVACGDCIKVCAIGAMELVPRHNENSRKIARADLKKCIACYCCDEACAYDAISVRKGWLGESLRRTRR